MRYAIHKTGGGFLADNELVNFLNSLQDTDRVISIEPGRYGKYHGLDEENEAGYKIIVHHGGGRSNG